MGCRSKVFSRSSTRPSSSWSSPCRRQDPDLLLLVCRQELLPHPAEDVVDDRLRGPDVRVVRHPARLEAGVPAIGRGLACLLKLWSAMDSLSKQAKAPVGQSLYSRTRPRLSLLIVGPLLVAVTACGARSHVSVRRASPVRCPYRNPANSLSSLRLTPRQLEACRRSFKLPTPTNAAAAR